MNKPTLREIDLSLRTVDPGCYWTTAYGKNEIVFDNDTNNNEPWLSLKLYKDFIKINRGFKITQTEKEQIRFFYDKYDNIELLVDDIVKYTKRYFKSFRIIYKRV